MYNYNKEQHKMYKIVFIKYLFEDKISCRLCIRHRRKYAQKFTVGTVLIIFNA